MNITTSMLRSVFECGELASPDLTFWFEHTAFPLVVTRAQPTDYQQFDWSKLKATRLVSITAGFQPKSNAIHSGYAPVLLNTHVSGFRAIRLVRFTPDSNTVSVEASNDPTAQFTTTTLNCKVGSVAIVGQFDSVGSDERELCSDKPFSLQMTLHSRKIELP